MSWTVVFECVVPPRRCDDAGGCTWTDGGAGVRATRTDPAGGAGVRATRTDPAGGAGSAAGLGPLGAGLGDTSTSVGSGLGDGGRTLGAGFGAVGGTLWPGFACTFTGGLGVGAGRRSSGSGGGAGTGEGASRMRRSSRRAARASEYLLCGLRARHLANHSSKPFGILAATFCSWARSEGGSR